MMVVEKQLKGIRVGKLFTTKDIADTVKALNSIMPDGYSIGVKANKKPSNSIVKLFHNGEYIFLWDGGDIPSDLYLITHSVNATDHIGCILRFAKRTIIHQSYSFFIQIAISDNGYAEYKGIRMEKVGSERYVTPDGIEGSYQDRIHITDPLRGLDHISGVAFCAEYMYLVMNDMRWPNSMRYF